MDRKLIEHNFEVLNWLFPKFQAQEGARSLGKLEEIIDFIPKHYDSLLKISLTVAKENFAVARKLTFLQMIEIDKEKLQTFLQSIDATLYEGGSVYNTCLDFDKLTSSIDKQLLDCMKNLIQISNSYNPKVNLTNSLDGPILAVMDQIFKLEKHRDKIIRRENELRNLIGPRLDNLLFHKTECISNLQKEDPTTSDEIEYYASILNGFISILESL